VTGPQEAAEQLPAASFTRRLLSLAYELILAVAVAFFAGLLFYGAASGRLSGLTRFAFQCYLFAALGLYFTWCWHRGGQTLPMKAWQIRLVDSKGGPVSWRQAALRYILAWVSLLPLGAGFLWALVDPQRLSLHDRLSGTRVVTWKRDRATRG
jgi:uncharacterized RDD family membrane protein YckC